MSEITGLSVSRSPSRCPYCHEGVVVEAEEWVVCAACLARHHEGCWREAGRCATCGERDALGRVAVDAPGAASPPARGTVRVVPPELPARPPIALSLTPAARAKALEYLRASRHSHAAIRITLSAEGALGLEIDHRREGDRAFDAAGVPFVAPVGLEPELDGLRIDFQEASGASGFSFGGPALALRDPGRAREAARRVRAARAIRSRQVPWRGFLAVVTVIVGLGAAFALDQDTALGGALAAVAAGGLLTLVATTPTAKERPPE